MATAFSRTMRVLKTDSARFSLWGWLLAILFLVGWFAWFLLARVTVYQVSTAARLASANEAVADFAPDALVWLQPGQAAWLTLDSFSATQYGTVSATVVAVGGIQPDGHLEVSLALHPDPGSPIPLQAGLTGTVEVAVERVSPAILVLRAAGQVAAGPRPTTPPPEK